MSSTTSLDLFLQECGMPGPLDLLVERASWAPARWLLRQPFAVLGRSPEADVVLRSRQVSTRHAYIQVLDGLAYIIDLGSRTGLVWADGLRETGILDPDEPLGIGPFTLRISRGVKPFPTGDTENKRTPRADTAPPTWFELTLCGVCYPPWRMSRPIALVGRSPKCKVCVQHDSVSRYHCALVRTRRGVWVVDLLGRGGVRVNGTPTRVTLLEDGDRLTVGECSLVHRLDEPGHSRSVVLATVTPAAPQPLEVTPTSPASGRDFESLLLLLANEFAHLQVQMLGRFREELTTALQYFSATHRENQEQVTQELLRLQEIARELESQRARLKGVDESSPRLPPLPSPTQIAGPGPATMVPGAQQPAPENLHAWLSERVALLEKEQESGWRRIMNFLTGKKPAAKPDNTVAP